MLRELKKLLIWEPERAGTVVKVYAEHARIATPQGDAQIAPGKRVVISKQAVRRNLQPGKEGVRFV